MQHGKITISDGVAALPKSRMWSEMVFTHTHIRSLPTIRQCDNLDDALSGADMRLRSKENRTLGGCCPRMPSTMQKES